MAINGERDGRHRGRGPADRVLHPLPVGLRRAGPVRPLADRAMSYNPAEDFDIKAVATQHGIDWRLLKALRQAENGSAGREFGVLAVSARTWTEQAEVAARTIRHTIGRYWQHVKADPWEDRKSTRLNSSHSSISYAVFCLKKKKNKQKDYRII